MEVNSTNSEYIYTGVWTDWSYGRLFGATLTLSAQNAGFLTAFISLFVTISAAHLWRIIIFIVHQIHSSPKPQDALHHQQQVIFKNTTSPASLAWESIILAWAWRSNARHSFIRNFFFVLLPLAWLAVAGAAAILSAKATKAASHDCLIMSDNCGMWTENTGNKTGDPNTLDLFSAIQLQSINSATLYSRTCYDEDNKALPQCQLYTQTKLPFTTKTNTSCPFRSGTCIEGDTAAFTIDTGLLDSNYHLGMNTPEDERILFRKMVTCAPLARAQFVTVHNDSNPLPDYPFTNSTVAAYHYGTVDRGTIQNETFRYDIASIRANIAYLLTAQWSSTATAESAKTWVPIPELNRTDADVSIFFFNANNVMYEYPIDDPIFGAHRSALEELSQIPEANTSIAELDNWYLPDSYTTVLGCTDQYQLCNGASGRCTPINGMGDLTYHLIEVAQTLDLSNPQLELFSLLSNFFVLNNMYYSIYGRSSSALRAMDTIADLNQMAPLPANQWQIEVQGLFEANLAKLQERSVEFATGPRYYREGRTLLEATAKMELCGAQKVRCPAGNISFSVLGVACIIGIGCVIIMTNLSLDAVMEFVGRKWFPASEYRRINWVLDDKLQLQRMAFEGSGYGDWKGHTDAVPVTAKGQVFGGWADVNERHPYLGKHDRLLVSENVLSQGTEIPK